MWIPTLAIPVGDLLRTIPAAGLLQGADAAAPVDNAFIFLVSFLVGTVAILAGSRTVVDRDSGWGRAAITALLGAAAWVIVNLFVGWIPLLGPVLALLAWIGVINVMYEGGWLTAIAIGLAAWLIAVAILWLLTLVGLVGVDAFGVPV